MSRIPGPIGLDDWGGKIMLTRPGSCLLRFYDPNTLTSSPGPMGGGSSAPVATPVASHETKDARTELDLLRRLYGTMKNSSNTEAYFTYDVKKKAWMYKTAAYIAYRGKFFGSTAMYYEFKKNAKLNLDANEGDLRRFVDPNRKKRKKHSDWKDAQDVFYAWVKKAYENQAGGDPQDYATVIKAQKSEKLKRALATVKVDYGSNFSCGGFNPRPVKRPNGVFLLGTISEHGVGNAIDIDSSKNPQIKSSTWRFVLAYTGKTVNQAQLHRDWKSKDSEKAKSVYDTIKGVNDEWVAKLKNAVKKLEDEALVVAKAEVTSTTSATAKPTEGPDHLATVIAADSNLEKIGAAFVKRWQDGFLGLEWELVKELHEEGFKWGAVFRTPDLHHFEM